MSIAPYYIIIEGVKKVANEIYMDQSSQEQGI
jgi:hypothetical protein